MGNICNSKSENSSNTLISEHFCTTKKKTDYSIIENSKLYNLLLTSKNKSIEMENDFLFTTKSILNDYSSSIIFFNLIFDVDKKNPDWKIKGIEWIDTPYERLILKANDFLPIFKTFIDFKTIVFVSDSSISKMKCENISDIMKNNKVNSKSIYFYCKGMKNFDLKFSNFDTSSSNYLSPKFYLPLIVVDYKDYKRKNKKKVNTINFAQNISFFLKNLNLENDFDNYLKYNNIQNIIFIVSSDKKELKDKIKKINEKIKLIFIDPDTLIIESTKKLKKIIQNSIKDKNSNSLIITETEKHLHIYYQYLKERLNLRIYYIKTYFESLFIGEKKQFKMFESKKERSVIKRKNSNTLNSLKKYLKLYCKKYEYFEMKRISLKILDNILNDPFQGKFRLIKNSSKKLNEIFFEKDYGTKILFNFGFKLIKGDEDQKVKEYKNSLETQEIKKIKEIFIFVLKNIELNDNKNNNN